VRTIPHTANNGSSAQEVTVNLNLIKYAPWQEEKFERSQLLSLRARKVAFLHLVKSDVPRERSPFDTHFKFSTNGTERAENWNTPLGADDFSLLSRNIFVFLLERLFR
jgi:hypothetical protein